MSQITPSTGADRPDHSSGQPDGTAPPPPGRTAEVEQGPSAPSGGRPIGLIIALAVAVGVIAALIGVLVWPSDDAGDVATEPTTSLAPTTTATPTTEPSTTAPTTVTTVPAPVDTSPAVFPYASGTVRYEDPVEAARAFAVDFVGFTDPVVGEFMQGDARSGEVEVRPVTNGPATTVFVRQLGSEGTWWVLGSGTANIVIDAPTAGGTIASPVTVSGSALAFEGTVNVEIRQDGARQPIGTDVVTGGGDIVRPFSGDIEFSIPTEPHGAVVFLTRSEQDGRVWEAGVVRVSFA